MYATDSKAIRIAIAGIIAGGLLQVAHALGLGPITVNSHIGEPLRATIDVTGLAPGQPSNMVVSVADAKAYQARGIKKLPSHDQLNLSLQSTANGHYINISTPSLIREPFINFVLSVKHDGKETLREYAVFLDPVPDSVAIPTTTSEPLLQITNTVSDNKTIPGRRKLLVDQPATASATGWKGGSAETAAPVSGLSKNWQGSTYGPVQKGETLFSIAEKVRPSADYSIQTIMRQIYRANPRAFSSNQLGSLMAGYSLTIPVFTKDLVAMPSSRVQAVSRAANVAQGSGNIISAEMSQASGIEDSETDTEVTHNIFAGTGEDQSSLGEVAVDDTETAQMDATLGEYTEAPVAEVENNDGSDGGDMQIADESGNAQQEVSSTALRRQTGHSSDQPQGNVDITSINTAQSASKNREQVDLAENSTIVSQTENGTQVSEPSVVDVPTIVERPVQVTAPVNSDVVVVEQPIEEKGNPQSFFNTTYAFFPMWQWLAIGAILIVLFALLLIKQRKKHTTEDVDTLDAGEMDAVLAKINALEKEEHRLIDEDEWLNEEHGQLSTDFSSAKSTAMVRGKSAEPRLEDEFIFDQEAEKNLDDNGFLVDLENDNWQDPQTEHESDFEDKASKYDSPPANAEVHIFEEDDYDFFLADDDDDASKQRLSHGASNLDENNEFLQAESPNRQPVTKDESYQPNNNEEIDFFLSEADGSDPDPENVPVVKNEKQPNIHQKNDFAFEGLDDLFESENEVEAESNPSFGRSFNREEDNTFDSIIELDELAAFDGEERAKGDNNESHSPVNPEEMEINLDLAVSFMATGHGERAVAWLEEVLEVGTEEQKERAQKLLDKARGA